MSFRSVINEDFIEKLITGGFGCFIINKILFLFKVV